MLSRVSSHLTLTSTLLKKQLSLLLEKCEFPLLSLGLEIKILKSDKNFVNLLKKLIWLMDIFIITRSQGHKESSNLSIFFLLTHWQRPFTYFCILVRRVSVHLRMPEKTFGGVNAARKYQRNKLTKSSKIGNC